jgi:ribosomal-protein-serine acetyltransferase
MATDEQRLQIDGETYLRTPKISDAPQFLSIIDRNRDDLIASFKWVEGIRDTASAAHFIDEEKDRLALGNVEPFLLFSKERMVGAVSLMLRNNDTFEIGGFLDRASRGRGLARTAVVCVLNYGFYDLGLQRAKINTDHSNTAGKRVVEQLGFTYEQITFDTRLDECAAAATYNLLKSEWTNRRR